VDNTRPQRKKVAQEHLEIGPGERTIDSGLQVQLEKDRTRHSGIESNRLWPMWQREQQGKSCTLQIS